MIKSNEILPIFLDADCLLADDTLVLEVEALPGLVTCEGSSATSLDFSRLPLGGRESADVTAFDIFLATCSMLTLFCADFDNFQGALGTTCDFLSDGVSSFNVAAGVEMASVAGIL